MSGEVSYRSGLAAEAAVGRDYAARGHRVAARLGPRQLGRIARSAEAFLGGEPRGTDTPARIDVALVDGSGRLEILENVLAA